LKHMFFRRPSVIQASDNPVVKELEPGTYYWCSCGRSKTQPLCDGSHEGTEHKPIEFSVSKKKKYAFCACKHTGKPPFCDNGHKARIFRLEAGTYFWCQCGKSENQPWCDGSHEGTSHFPLEFQMDKEERVAMCNCKHTACAPFCDNAHREV